MTTKLFSKNSLKTFIFAALALVMILAMPAHVFSQVAPAPTQGGSSFEQRLAQRKAERNIVLDDKAAKRLQSVCVRSQGKLRALQQQVIPAMTNRQKTYESMDAKLWIVIGKLKTAEKDTFNLEKQRVTLAEKAAKFQETSRLYQQTFDDLLVVNCQADPAGFKALLDTSRYYRGQLRDQSTDIRNYTVNDIKKSLTAFAADLQVKPATAETKQ